VSNVTRTPIVDKNGKSTTVYKKNGTDAPETRDLPQSPVLSAKSRPTIAMNSDYVRIPEGVSPEHANIAYNYIGERLIGETDDPIGARADYAEVTEEGVVYGMNVNDEYMGQVFAGRKRDDEDEDEYTQRKIEAAHENSQIIKAYLEESYGADVGEGNSEDFFTVEFYVEYEDENPRMSSLEWMGERAENETKLLPFSNDYLYGNKMQSGLAEKAGYHYELTDTPNRQIGDGYWVKDGE